MPTYFKAVHPDGSSFHDRRFRWLPESGPIAGHVVTHPTATTVGGDSSQYLSVSVSPTDCTGMQWPCRLLEVEPVDGHEVTTPRPEGLPSKRAAVAWRVVRELPATDALGPNGVHVAALLERAGRLTYDESRRLDSAWAAAWGAWDAAWDAAWDSAWAAAWTAARDAAWDAAWDAARDAARGARDAAWDAARDAAWDAAWDAARDAARGARASHARDAAGALVVRDLISTEHYDTLTRPWKQVIGPIHPDDHLED